LYDRSVVCRPAHPNRLSRPFSFTIVAASTKQTLLALCVTLIAGLVALKSGPGTTREASVAVVGAGVAALLTLVPLRAQEDDARNTRRRLAEQTKAFNVQTALIKKQNDLQRTLNERAAYQTRLLEAQERLLTEQEGRLKDQAVQLAELRRAVGMSRLGSGSNHDGSQLKGERFDRIDAKGHSFRDAHMEDAVFAGMSDLAKADFTKASMDRVTLNSVLLIGAKFERTQANGAHFDGAWLNGADFNHANLGHARFVGATISEANFCSAFLRGANFEGLQEPNVGDFSCADLRETNWRNANMERACFYGAAFSDGQGAPGSDFTGSGSYLGVDFRYAQLENCTFADIGIESFDSALPAQLDHAVIAGTDFSRCDALAGWHLRGALADARTRWPPGYDSQAAGVVTVESITADELAVWWREREEQISKRRDECSRRL
jgi:uncharacterized protein YjbI with pentapeptide repeats